MKNVLVLFVIIFLGLSSVVFSQSRSKSALAILGGINFQTLNGKLASGERLESDMLLGYHGGFNIQIPVVSEFYFQPGLMYSMKGAKSTNALGSETTKIGYVEIPLNLVYKSSLGQGFFFLGFGPYLGYAINGNVQNESSSVTIDREIKFKNIVESGDNLLVPYYKTFDAGGNVFLGFESAGGIFLQVETQFGMLNINPEDKRILTDKSSKRNKGFGMSLGYRF